MIRLVENRWFALADLVLVVSAGIGWVLVPQLGWRLLPLALLPWAFRLAAGRFPFKRTRFDLLLLVFLLTAVVGVWAAYNREAALAKFWLLVAGILLFYVLAGQPKANLWLIAGLISVFGVGVAVTFLLTQDWQTNQAKINLVQKLAIWWMDVRPGLMSGQIHHNTAGGMMAITAPFVVVLGIHAWREKKRSLSVFMVVVALLIVIGLLMTTSWGAWVASGTALGLWLLWMLSRILAKFVNRSSTLIFGTAVILATILAVIVVSLTSGGVLGFTERFLGATNLVTRLELAQSTHNLVVDFPLTGGGLASFPGLYSHYILGIPFYYYGYSHNHFFDVVLEQGILGFLMFTLIYLSCFWLLFSKLLTTTKPSLILASFASLIIILIHGLVDNVIYYQWGTLLVFMIPGLVVGITRPSVKQLTKGTQFQKQTPVQTSHFAWRILAIGGVVTVALVFTILGFTNRQNLLSSWHANLGSVEMARIELADFPSGKWDDERYIELLHPVEQYFLRALDHNPNNRTAQHRLGLMALQRRDFSTAITYLETAYRIDSHHRGIQKSLGYAYAWAGEFDLAYQLLTQIPEARQEMSTYVWWWQTQGREDLADNANNMLATLDSQTN
jgi:hypothetical protein